MDLNDVTATVKTAFCNTQIAEAFAAAVVASSKGKENIIQESYDLEIKKLSNELKTIKNSINDLQQSFLNKFNADSNPRKTSELDDGYMGEDSSTSEEFLNREWKTMQRYIYEHFKNQTEIQTKVKEIEDYIIHGRENFSLKSNEIYSLEKNLEVSTEHITTLAYLIENQKDRINSLEEKVGVLENKINCIDEKFITNLQILENVAKLTDSLMNALNNQTKSWENSCKILKKLSSDAGYLIKRTAGTFEENSVTDELALLLKKFIDAMQSVQPLYSVPNF
ncbi:chromosome segregation ATPases [Cryptosporidium sp. chipmunk genotype I]|uniref:chromosome segregation ATPases n=1 Tax=Cryptosporidium sp. chipmunk genotype I TaxID=1280935 RepID=UPI00351A983A|nr:chromosome segregation ATPases [Cryptosporidium sp. chipmunk genotype I]